MKLYLYIIGLVLSLSGSAFGQDSIQSIFDLHPPTEFENIHLQKLSSDDRATTFVIWVKLSVKVHKHETHTEHVYVLEGEGNFILGEETMEVKAGDFIFIPMDTWHGVNVTSEKTMKVISVQSPEFKGLDRVFKTGTEKD